MEHLESIRAPRADTERFCPYHGGYILLANCPILATNEDFNAEAGAPPITTARRPPTAPAGFAATVGVDTEDEDETADVADEPPAARPASTGRTSVSMIADTINVGVLLKSRIDEEERVVLARAPGYQRRRGRPAPTLKSTAELALHHGGPASRPARACPHCRHPLPATLDYRDAYPVVLVGHTESSKTSTVLAIIDEAGNCEPSEIGASTFIPTEATMRYLQRIDPHILVNFRRGTGPHRSQRTYHPPLEFVTTLGVGGPSISILLHDVAGEDLTDRNLRMKRAPSVLWADAIVFMYNPEDSPSLDRTGVQDQAAILNGIRDDLEARGPHDASGHPYKDPPLLVVVSKADLILDPENLEALETGAYSDQDVQKQLRRLRDGAVINAAKRFPKRSWHFIAPMPEDGGGPQGVISLFRQLLVHLRG